MAAKSKKPYHPVLASGIEFKEPDAYVTVKEDHMFMFRIVVLDGEGNELYSSVSDSQGWSERRARKHAVQFAYNRNLPYSRTVRE